MSGLFTFSRIASLIKTRALRRESFNIGLTLSAVRNFSVTNIRNMKLVQFTYLNDPSDVRVGFVEGDGIVDVNKVDSTLPKTLIDVLKIGALPKIQAIKCSKPTVEPMSGIRLEAPITGMDKVLCIGLNYRDHCEEQNLKVPEVPIIFSKFASTVTGPSDPVKLRTEVTKKVDWEAEMVVVMGKEASCVKSAEALNYVLGYTVAQDISARDWQKERNGGQFLLGKAMDNFCPIGPWIVTSDEICDPQCLNIKCCVNGVLKQDSNTCQLIHKIPDVIARLSSLMTLLPGDIILTGTPGGVGMHRSPPEYLKPGDVVTSEIEKIGVLQTNFVEYKN